ncbi:MAG: hypothetical protein LBI74_09395 [Synergistaceae bacterium]|jgi:hypothetical protein|nr:hypothetical protein [Synergistaceae bacterium]
MTHNGYKIPRISRVEHFDEDELIRRLRSVSMLDDATSFPYRDSRIELREMPHGELHPAQRYVLSGNVKRLEDLRWLLNDRGFDLFKLDGFLRIWLDDEEAPVDLLPPIVEESRHDGGGRPINIVCDGMHRVYLSYVQWVTPQIVFIRGIPREYPYYAYPLRDSNWGSLEIWDSIPRNAIKKWHRIRDDKRLYRNFNSAFENVGAPRGSGR